MDNKNSLADYSLDAALLQMKGLYALLMEYKVPHFKAANSIAHVESSIRHLHRIIKDENAQFRKLLLDPAIIHVNMLRGTIARISMLQCAHIYGEDMVVRWRTFEEWEKTKADTINNKVNNTELFKQWLTLIAEDVVMNGAARNSAKYLLAWIDSGNLVRYEPFPEAKEHEAELRALETLSPCPFCGNKNITANYSDYADDKVDPNSSVWCSNGCGVEIKVYSKDKKAAWKAWNRRSNTES